MTSFRSLTARQETILSKNGIGSPRELLLNFPFRYEDRRNAKAVAAITAGEWATVLATVLDKKMRRSFRGRVGILEAVITDGRGNLHVVWFNQPWLDRAVEKGKMYYFFGRASLFPTRGGQRLQLENPDVEEFRDDGRESIHAGRIVPVYRKIGSFGTKSLRTMMHKVLQKEDIEEPLPSSVMKSEGFPGAREAFSEIHFPGDEKAAAACSARSSGAARRFVFEELFSFEIMAMEEAVRRRTEKARPIRKDPAVGDLLRKSLPFALTGAQKRVFREISDDLSSDRPMYRLLQGDVGSGKTMMAFLSMAWAALSGFQAAYMAPTETLAFQVFLRFSEMAGKLGLKPGLLLSSTRAAGRKDILAGLKSGRLRTVIGTHALFQEGVEYDNLNLVVIDEQHRFGVRQRAALAAKGVNPHLLAMTATPIPRSLALTLYGDLDVSALDELPPNRAEVVTAVRNENSRDKIEDFARRIMDSGKQVIYVFPQIEENEAMDLQAAANAFDRYRLGPYRGYPAALLHGRMKPSEKEQVMDSMRRRETLLLVATTVVEVGIDLPRAGMIVVENAERFGLAQLHQLRGRVGRGGEKGYCVLMTGKEPSKLSSERLRVLEETSDGFKIAEEDLRLRGAGELAGVRQWGVSQFVFADPARDLRMIEKARAYAEKFFKGGLFVNEAEKAKFEEWQRESAKKFRLFSRGG